MKRRTKLNSDFAVSGPDKRERPLIVSLINEKADGDDRHSAGQLQSRYHGPPSCATAMKTGFGLG